MLALCIGSIRLCHALEQERPRAEWRSSDRVPPRKHPSTPRECISQSASPAGQGRGRLPAEVLSSLSPEGNGESSSLGTGTISHRSRHVLRTVRGPHSEQRLSGWTLRAKWRPDCGRPGTHVKKRGFYPEGNEEPSHDLEQMDQICSSESRCRPPRGGQRTGKKKGTQLTDQWVV